MKINKVSLLKLTLPLKHPYLNVKEGYVTEKHSLLFKVVLADDHETAGWGEAAENLLLTGQKIDEMVEVAKQVASTVVKQDAAEALTILGKVQPNSVKYGLETAILAAICQADNKSFADYLQLPGQRVELMNDAVEPVVDAETMLEDSTELFLLDDYERIKYQINAPDSEIDRLLRLPFLLPDKVRVRIELTEPWTDLDAALNNLQRLANSQLRIDYLQLPEQALLPENSPLPLAVPATGLPAAKRIIAAGAMPVVNLLTCGGPMLAVQILQLAAEQGVNCVIAGAGENAVGLTMAAKLAAGFPNVKYCDLPGLDQVAPGPFIGGVTLHQSKLLVPPSAGLGLTVDENSDQLEMLTEVFH
jgi:L-alanine-DL-glutamate epimerase-like enolase superfamily enzyme